MNNPREKLESILLEEEKKIRLSYSSKNMVFPLIEIIRSLDYHTCILGTETNDETKSELLELYKFGWSQAYKTFFKEFNLTDRIPFFEFEKEQREWIDSTIQYSGSIQFCKKFLNYHKADLLDLMSEGKDTFKFSYLVDRNGIEYFDRISLKYYHSLMNKVLEPKRILLLKKMPEIREQLFSIVSAFQNIFIQYKATKEIDLFYSKLGYHHLMTTQVIDDFNEDDSFGNLKYKDFLDVVELSIKNAKMHRDCCLTLCQKTNYKVNLRNILSYGFGSKSMFQLASQNLNWDEDKVREAFSGLLLSKENYHYHLDHSGCTSAPYFELGPGTWMRSTFGCIDMPVFFLNRELKRKYESDYFKAVNRREERFRNQLYSFFDQPQIITVKENINIKKRGKIHTDIDAVIYDKERKVLGLFQLKWQDPYSKSMKERFSKISNLIPKSIEWIEKINTWLTNNETKEILKTCNLENDEINEVYLFVIVRHHVNFTNQKLDKRANWCSWFQLIEASTKVKDLSNSNPIAELSAKLSFFSPEERLKREDSLQLDKYEMNFSKYKVIVE